MDATRISLCPATSGQSQQYRSQHSVAGRESRRARRAGPEIVRRRGRHPYPSKLASRAVRRAAAPGAMTTSGRPPVALAADSPSPSARRAADERRAHLDAAAYVEAHDLERVLADALRHVHRVCASPAAPPGPGPAQPQPPHRGRRGLLPDPRRGTPRRRPRVGARHRDDARPRSLLGRRARRAGRRCRRAARADGATRSRRSARTCPAKPSTARTPGASAEKNNEATRRRDDLRSATGRRTPSPPRRLFRSPRRVLRRVPRRDSIRRRSDRRRDGVPGERRVRRARGADTAVRGRDAEAGGGGGGGEGGEGGEGGAGAREGGRGGTRGAERPRGAAAASAARLLRRDGHEPPP